MNQTGEKMSNLKDVLPQEVIPNLVYDVLCAFGAAPEIRSAFCHWFYEPLLPGSREWRFQGQLGFGGKFFKERDRMFVTCCPDDMN